MKHTGIILIVVVLGGLTIGYGAAADHSENLGSDRNYVDTFEDGDVSEYNDVETGKATSEVVYEGEYAASVTDQNDEMFKQNGHYTGNLINRTFDASRPSKLAVAVRITGDFYDDGRVIWRNQTGATIHNIHLDNSDQTIEYGGNRIRGHESNTWYYVELKQIDWNNNTIGKITVNETVEATDVEFLNPADNVSEVEISINGAGTGAKVFVDNLRYSGRGTNQKPTGEFSANSTSPTVGESVTFDASASSDDDSIRSYEWDFNGDGTVEATGETASHSFSQSGTYTVSLTVTDSDGVSTTSTKEIVVTEQTSTTTTATTTTSTTPTTTTTTTTATTTTTKSGCQPENDGVLLQTAQLQITDSTIKDGDPGEVTGTLTADGSNNCPVIIRLTLSVPDGVQFTGGPNLQSIASGVSTSMIQLEPGDSIRLSGTVSSEVDDDVAIRSSVLYYPQNHEGSARNQDLGVLKFESESPPKTTTTSTTTRTTTTTATTTSQTTTQPSTEATTKSTTATSQAQDSDGDGVPDDEDYAPNDPDVQEKSDLQEDSSESITVPGFGIVAMLGALTLTAALLGRNEP